MPCCTAYTASLNPRLLWGSMQVFGTKLKAYGYVLRDSRCVHGADDACMATNKVGDSDHSKEESQALKTQS